MALEVDCGSCGGRFRVPDSAAGKKIRCPKCKGAIEVAAGAQPASDEAAPAPAAQAPAAPTPAAWVPPAAPKKAPPAAVTAPAASPPARSAAPAPAVLKMPAPAPAKLETIAAKSAPAPKPAPPPPQEDTWYFQAEDGEVYGPVERSELEEWRREGRISPECRLRSSASEDWIVPGDFFPEIVPAEPEPELEAEEPASEERPAAKPGKKKAAARTRAPASEDDPEEEPRSTRSKAVAFVLAFFLFWTGGHRFYLGYPALGVVLALSFGGLLIGSWVDAFCILFGALPDVEGRKLRD